MVKAIIFDMDGTMIDNMMVHHRAWQQKLSELGLEMSLEEVRRQIHGINEEILERLFGNRFTQQERIRIAAEKELTYREIFLPELKLIEGLDIFLQQVFDAGLPMAIATAAPLENVDFVLDHLSLRKYFSVILHASDVKKGKPDPEIYLKASSALGFYPQECLVFEDSPTGARSAATAGCKICVITTTHQPSEFVGIPNILSFYENFEKIELSVLQPLL